MIGIMLLGAWFLVHQHCCVADMRTSSRSNLVDHLMRRSPLEKNFMRYGRSWPPPNFISNGMWQMDERLDKPEKKGKTGRDIMRFGRSMWAPLEGIKGGSYSQDGSPVPRAESKEEPYVLSPDGKYILRRLSEGFEIGRNKKNFIRFGRGYKSPAFGMGKPKQSDVYYGAGKRKDPSFEGENGVAYEKDADESDNDPATRDLDEPTTTSSPDDNQCAGAIPPCQPCFDAQPFSLDATALNVPDLLKLMRYIPLQQSSDKRANNFIRLG